MEQELYVKYIDAQYDYFKFLETKRLPDLNKFMENKIQNPLYFGFASSSPCSCKEGPDDIIDVNIKDLKIKDVKYKKLKLFFHPDKNRDNIEEANKLFIFISNLINDKNYKVLDKIMSSTNKWKYCLELLNEKFTEKEEFCKVFPTTIIFNNDSWDLFYKSEEEVIKIYKIKIKHILDFNQSLFTMHHHWTMCEKFSKDIESETITLSELKNIYNQSSVMKSSIVPLSELSVLELENIFNQSCAMTSSTSSV
jgi:hypothetical protein